MEDFGLARDCACGGSGGGDGRDPGVKFGGAAFSCAGGALVVDAEVFLVIATRGEG